MFLKYGISECRDLIFIKVKGQLDQECGGEKPNFFIDLFYMIIRVPKKIFDIGSAA